MEYLLHKDFQEIAQRHALQTNSNMNFELEYDYIFYESFLFAENLLTERRHLVKKELQKLDSIEKLNETERGRRLQLKKILEDEFWFIDGISPAYRINF